MSVMTDTSPRAIRRLQFKRGFARKLRADATGPERKLWAYLRRKQLAHLRFRRQQPIGPYVADFFCSAAKLIIELDGSQHGAKESVSADEARTAWLEESGYKVLRFPNDEVLKNRGAVLETIDRVIRERSIPPAP
jgi:very-short-patch-repair endonuclease